MSIKLLNLGCGSKFHPFWTNVDFTPSCDEVITHDLKKGLPYPDATFDAVYHSHVLEHFERGTALTFLIECHRVLKTRGIIRVVVPDLEQIARLYLTHLERVLQGDQSSKDKYEWILLELFDQMIRNKSGGEMQEYWEQDHIPAEDYMISRVGPDANNFILMSKIRSREKAIKPKHDKGFLSKLRSLITAKPIRESFLKFMSEEFKDISIGKFRRSGEIHQWMYDRYSLHKLLESAGFTEIEVTTADRSSIPDFNSYDLDIEKDGSIRKPDSLFMEARK